MNKRDRDNLKFLMAIDEKTFDDWMNHADDDDIEYALQLIKIAKVELLSKQIELIDEVKDFSDAKEVIERIKNIR